MNKRFYLQLSPSAFDSLSYYQVNDSMLSLQELFDDWMTNKLNNSPLPSLDQFWVTFNPTVKLQYIAILSFDMSPFDVS